MAMVWVVCPYYKELRNQSIICEGVQQKTTIHLAFPTKDGCEEYMDAKCRACYTDCWIAKMHNERYRKLLED